MRTTFRPERRACAECGRDFIARARDVVRCSDVCGMRAHRVAVQARNLARLRAWMQAARARREVVAA